VFASNFEVGGGGLAALCAILLTVVVLALIVARMMKRDPTIRIARLGVFIQRERLEKPEGQDEYLFDPFSDESESRPAPLPPPTPPPPLPPRPPDDPTDDTQAWPRREESP